MPTAHGPTRRRARRPRLAIPLVVVGYIVVYQQIENYWLSPRISAKTMERALDCPAGGASPQVE